MYKRQSYNAVLKVAKEEFFNTASAKEKEEASKSFNDWAKEIDKSKNIVVYDKNGFRAFYAEQYFERRFENVIQAWEQMYHAVPSDLFLQAKSFVSIGCGPGSCIAGIISFLRESLGIEGRVTFKGVDKVEEWRPYIEALNGVDKLSKVEFQHAVITEANINRFRADVCIMSYIDAKLCSSTYFNTLRNCFYFVVILDQSQPDGKLKENMIRAGFISLSYQLSHQEKPKMLYYAFKSIRRNYSFQGSFYNQAECYRRDMERQMTSMQISTRMMNPSPSAPQFWHSYHLNRPQAPFYPHANGGQESLYGSYGSYRPRFY